MRLFFDTCEPRVDVLQGYTNHRGLDGKVLHILTAWIDGEGV